METAGIKRPVTTTNSAPATVVTASATMIVYVLCVLLILHAFTQDAVMAQVTLTFGPGVAQSLKALAFDRLNSID
ncbi:unnamed protein product [Heligmosomoides polygyrus]|uniref:Uncharacterized protein n=1 Tax=Heligmosomoides polygyrus TaxID=6339 RepID=A0A183GJA4_HELPZ|nr:unnamed protein product [Heligmosomoides polygyrus]